MGVVQRESIQSTIVSYGGAALGFVNQLLLFTQFLTKDEIGLVNVIILIAITYAQFSGLGAGNVILRFFPFFRQSESGHNGLLFGMIALVTVGFGIFSVLFFLFHGQIVAYFGEKAPLLTSYINYVIPLAYCWILLNVFDSYLRSLFKTVVSTFVREVLKRLAITIVVGLYALSWVSFEEFVLLYIALHCAQPLLLIGYTWYLGELKITPQFGRVWQRMYKRVLMYGGVSFLAFSAAQIIGYIDSIMLAGMVGEGEAGVYTISLYVTSLIVIPWRALSKVTSAQVAEYWKHKNLVELGLLYKKTSVINLVVASFCFLGIWINRENIIAIIGEEFREGVWVLLFTGLGRVISMWVGLNSFILNLSRKYLYDFWINIFMIVFGVASNFFLIKTYGIKGATMATLLTLSIVNVVRLLLVWKFFCLQPFSWAMIKCFVIAGIAYGVSELVPILSHYLLDIPVRSGLFSVIFVGLLLGLKVSPDINAFVEKTFNRIVGKS